MYSILINLDKEMFTIVLRDKNYATIEKRVTTNIRNSANEILQIIDEMCSRVNISKENIEKINIKSTLGDSAITQRAVRTISKTWSYARLLTKA